MKRFTPVMILLFWSFTALQAQWDADAGLYHPLSQREGVQVTTSSGSETQAYMVDGNPGTQWISDPLLPIGFLEREDLNALFDTSTYQVSGSSIPDLSVITGGSLYGLSRVSAVGGSAWLHFTFDSTKTLSQISGRMKPLDDSIFVYAIHDTGDSTLLASLAPGDYTWHRWAISAGDVDRIAIYSDGDFLINEIGALQASLTEEVIVDLGSIRSVTTIRSRHWSTYAKSIQLLYSHDSTTWTWISNLDPQAQNTQELTLESEISARYFKLVYRMMAQDYKRAYLWEFSPQDASAPYGLMPDPGVSPNTLSDMLGVNTFWGWGYNRYTDGLLPGEGPEMFTPVASYARDYHNMNWDIVDPDDDISFTDMVNTGRTPAQWWLDWEREYAAWISKGMPVHASIQFVDFPDSVWTNPYSSGYKYGLSFARFFGPTYGNGQVEIVEVGNEPWKYDSALYRTILRGMARGLKEGDPAMTVLPCALQAYNEGAEATSNKNYLGARITSTEAEYLDGINLHSYSFYKGVDGIRRGVHPEHSGSQMRGILNAIRWRNQNMPGKPVYVTEWGWDSDGANQACSHNECVSEAAAAAYVTRGLLMMQRMGVEKATYFYNSNLWGMTLFTRSGLTGGKEVNFIKKRSYYALESLNNLIGDRYFLDVLQEDEDAWIYLMGDSTGIATHIVAWRPIDADDNQSSAVALASNVVPLSAVNLDGRDADGTVVTLPTRKGNQLFFTLNAYPTVVEIQPIVVSVNQPYMGDEGGSGIIANGNTSTEGEQEEQTEDDPVGQPQLGLTSSPQINQPSTTPVVTSIETLTVDSEAEALPQKITPASTRWSTENLRRKPQIPPMIWLGPVPAQDVLTLRLDSNIEPNEVYQISVWDFHGRKYYLQTEGFQRENHIWVNRLPAGAYRVVVFLQNGTQIEQTVTVLR